MFYLAEDEVKQEAEPEAEKPAADPPQIDAEAQTLEPKEAPAKAPEEKAAEGPAKNPEERVEEAPLPEAPERGYPPVRKVLRAISLAALAVAILACVVLLLPHLTERPSYAFTEAGLFSAESAAGGLRVSHPEFLVQADNNEALLLSDGKYRISLYFEDVSAALQESLALGYSEEEAGEALFAAARQALAGDELPGGNKPAADGSVSFDFGSGEGNRFSCRMETALLGEKTVLAAVIHPIYEEEGALQLFSAVKGSLRLDP
ncbi:MAG: hypothetical protein LBU47_01495 [Christensenellaceae bacterium]|nr:hypothetical protein [Christensenellaceae bacterium]